MQSQHPPMQPRISMITLGVANIPRSIQFYADGLGLPQLDFPSEDVAFFTLHGTWLGIYGAQALAQDMGLKYDKQQVDSTSSNQRGVSLAHNLHSSQAVDNLMAKAVQAGATCIKKPQKVFWGGYSGYFADPDNHIWELAYNPHSWIGPADMHYQHAPTSQSPVLFFDETRWPTYQPIIGKTVTLFPLSLTHVQTLFDAFSRSDTLWEYLPYGPFTTLEKFTHFVTTLLASQQEKTQLTALPKCDQQLYVICKNNRPLGMAGYINISRPKGTIEIANICFSTQLQHTTAATEAMYLLLKHAMDNGFRRIVYTCDARNNAARRAARRFGFSFEGVFRCAQVIHNRCCDIVCYALTKQDWQKLYPIYQSWLQPDNFDEKGNHRTKLSIQTRPILHQFG